MIEKINLETAEIKGEFKKEIKTMKEKLSVIQQTIKEQKLPIIVIFEGWGASGKGSMISEMIKNLDPRSFKVFSSSEEEQSELRRPFLWKYWNSIPEYGRMAIFERSWYKEISTYRIEKKFTDEDFIKKAESINVFEKQLSDDGYLIIKFFLHISQKEQLCRLKKLDSDKSTSWRVTERDFKRNKHYNEYYKAFDEMCEKTNTEYSPWNVIGCHNKETAVYEMYNILINNIETALAKSIDQKKKEYKETSFRLIDMPILKNIDVNKTISEEDYDTELKSLQKKLFKLQNKLYRKKIPVIIAFEGWDAAGKGGAIKRVSAALDPRGYEAIPVAAPDKYELSHHYLWRFWKNVPKTGHTAIFDRSWYGRVMVERVENFATEEQWKRAYNEINEFENELCKWGYIVIKFWLQIDKDEQLKRFTERQNTPEKQWKITDEDWRNREKWDQYETAVNEMLQKTSTDHAPWNIIEAKDKKYARIKVLKTLINHIEKYID